MQKEKTHITIIGSGIGGCFLALELAKKGFHVDIYERISKEEVFDANSNRSYNLTFFSYGLNILRKAGLWEIIKPYLLPIKGSTTQIKKDSKPIFLPADPEKTEYFAISRAGLIQALVAEAEKNPLITMHFDTALLTIDRYAKTMTVQNTKTKALDTIACDVIFGADGVNSTVRPFVQQGQDSSHTQEYAEWSYKQIVISKELMDKMKLEDRTVHSWTRKNAFIISIPNADGSLSALLILPKNKYGYQSLKTPAAIKNLIEENFPVLLPALSDITKFLLENPESNFVMIHTNPWYYKDFLALIGDSAHGFYPFYGQGTSAAFGDAIQLIKLIDKYGTDWGKIFPLYQDARKRHMDALGEVSKEGFRTYRRHKKADYETIYVTLEMLAYNMFPKLFPPPLHEPVKNDPESTDDHVKQYAKQRKIARWLGIPLAVGGVTALVAMHEETTNAIKRLYLFFTKGSKRNS